MRKAIIAFSVLAAMLTSARADVLDVELKANRGMMVAAVALLGTLPPKCFVNHERPSPAAIYRFMASYGYRPDDAFLADLEARAREMYDNNKIAHLSEHDIRGVAEMMCGMGAIYSMKVRAK